MWRFSQVSQRIYPFANKIANERLHLSGCASVLCNATPGKTINKFYGTNSLLPKSIRLRMSSGLSRTGVYLHEHCYYTIALIDNHASKHMHDSGILSMPQNAMIKQCFHTSPRRQVPPFIWIFIKPVAKLATVLSSRYARKWWGKLPGEEKKEWKGRIYEWRKVIAGAVCALLLLVVVDIVTHIQETPITKRKRYIPFTQEQFAKIVALEAETLLEEAKANILPQNHPVYEQVVKVAQRIVDANQDLELMRTQKWIVVVIQDSVANAFVLPTGHIFVHTGLLESVLNLDQLAVVLGHEMAHAVLNHGAEQVGWAQALDKLIILSMAAIWFFMPTDGFAVITQWFYNKVIHLLLNMPYSRKLEAEADEVGLQLIAKACYDVRESSNFWEFMTLLDQQKNNEVPIPEWLSTHPANSTREEALRQMTPKAIDMRKLCECPDLPVNDPQKYMKQLKHILAQRSSATEKATKKSPTSQPLPLDGAMVTTDVVPAPPS